MCGIAGFAGRNAAIEGREPVQAMVRSLARRGPDSEGIESWQDAVLGHRRLAILDLSEAGRQPMVSADGELGLVFNGCIYNFQELRQDLEAQGRRFRSRTDTEVLLEGYDQWGIDELVRRCRGMFAFAIWDNRRRRLTMARDRLGVKPLVYAATHGGIAFASTVTALREAGLADEVDPEALVEFLEFGWISDERAIYREVRKVPAATIVEWQDGHLSQRVYWQPPEDGSRKLSFEQALEETEALLLEAVRLRLISDVPVGALLSGGVDSALICWAVAKLKGNLKAFTVSTAGDPSDEAPAARETAEILGIPHEIVELSREEQPDLNELTCAYGEPFAVSSALAMLRVSKAVKAKVTVLLTGDGGDDVFLGYKHHRRFWIAQKLARALPPGSDAVWWSTVRPLISRARLLRRPMHLTDYAAGGLGAVTRTHDGLPYYEQSGMIGERLAETALAHRQIPLSLASGKRLMRDFLEYERQTRFVAEYMTKVDGGAMRYAIEARSPFLDHRLWELAASLPVDLRLRRGELKAVLRELVRRRVGPSVARRQKQGFTVPVESWLTTGWKPQLDALSEESILEREGWVRRGSLKGAARHAQNKGSAPVQLWSLVVLENWFRANRGAACAEQLR